jgi:hypothetical protein
MNIAKLRDKIAADRQRRYARRIAYLLCSTRLVRGG